MTKEGLRAAGVPFPGHTEFLAHLCGGADVVMMLRLQQERMTSAFISTMREYHAQYGLTLARLKTLMGNRPVLVDIRQHYPKKDALSMGFIYDTL